MKNINLKDMVIWADPASEFCTQPIVSICLVDTAIQIRKSMEETKVDAVEGTILVSDEELLEDFCIAQGAEIISDYFSGEAVKSKLRSYLLNIK